MSNKLSDQEISDMFVGQMLVNSALAQLMLDSGLATKGEVVLEIRRGMADSEIGPVTQGVVDAFLSAISDGG